MDVSDAAIYNTQTIHRHSSNNTLQKDTTNNTYYIEQEFHLPAKKIKLTNIDTSIISQPITVNQALINQNGQFLPKDFNVQTGNLNPIDPVTGERFQSNAEYISSIDVTVPDMQLDKNQSPITENGDYVMYDMERNDTLDVVPQNENPQQQQRSLVLKASTRDATDDQTYRKIGVLNVDVQPVYQSKTVTIDNNSPNTQTINFDSPTYNALRNVTINKNITPVKLTVYKIATLNYNSQIISQVLVRNLIIKNSGQVCQFYGGDPGILLHLDGSGIFWTHFIDGNSTVTPTHKVLYYTFGSASGEVFIGFYDNNNNLLLKFYIPYMSDGEIHGLNKCLNLDSSYNNQWVG